MSTKPSSYRLHKPTGQAVVRIDGRDHYLGKHGTEVSIPMSAAGRASTQEGRASFEV